MKRQAIVWRQSVYDNEFKCNKCKTVCAGSDGMPKDDTLTDNTYLYCPKCRNPIAYFEMVDLGENDTGMMGNIEDYKRRKMS